MKAKQTNIQKSYVFGDPMYILSQNASFKVKQKAFSSFLKGF